MATKPLTKKPVFKKLAAPPRRCARCGGEEHRPSDRCGFCNLSQHLRPATPKDKPITRKLIAISPYAWGIGLLPEDAVEQSLKRVPSFFPQADRDKVVVQLWDCPRSAYVNQMGQIAWVKEPNLAPPKKLREGPASSFAKGASK